MLGKYRWGLEAPISVSFRILCCKGECIIKFLDQIILLITGLSTLYQIWRFDGRYSPKKTLFDLYYIPGFARLFVSGVLLIFLGYKILGLGESAFSPNILPFASLIPLCISIGIVEQYYTEYKQPYKWIALLIFLAIAITRIGKMESIKKIAVSVFHSVAGLVIFLGPIFAVRSGKAPKGFIWVGIGGALIGIGANLLAFLTSGSQLLFFSTEVIIIVLAPLLLFMNLAFTWGFVKDNKG
jgi:hypothetical protein